MAPRLIVGIDVGMTCTGVAYALLGDGIEMTDPHVIQKWPGNYAGQSNKAPTVICYNNKQISSWGFLCQNEDMTDPDLEDHDWFKIYLDPEEYRKAKAKARAEGRENEVPPSHQDVRRYYRDFLSCLYPFVADQLKDTVGSSSWSQAEVEFIFSVPTTWTAIGVTNDFVTLANEAGFGRGGTHHTLTAGLTEAEAAAVYTFKAQSALYADNDILLIVDAGGGTTDLSLLRASVKPGQLSKLEALDEVRGDGIGSVAIDEAFISLVINRLTPVISQLGITQIQLASKAEEMAQKSFKPHKEGFGNIDSDRQVKKMIDIPGIADTITIPEVGIRRGKLEITNYDLEDLFRPKLKQMVNLINFQMNKMSQVAPHDQISHLILSGGLGSSLYVKNELIKTYITQSSNKYARNIRVITSSLPQLAVVKGIVMDRLRGLQQNQRILPNRICRMSLGVVCKQLYDPIKHKNQDLVVDAIDGQRYAKGQIRWFVKQACTYDEQGEPLESETVEYEFYRNLKKHAAREVWTDQIAMCNNPRGKLPQSIKEDGYHPLCLMRSDLTAVPVTRFEYKKKRWWQSNKPASHYKALHSVKFVMKPSTVDFELWFEGRKYNENASIEVQWQEGAQVSAPKAHILEEIISYTNYGG